MISFSSLLLLASQSAYLYDPMFQETKTIPCFDQPIHTLISQSAAKSANPTQFLAAAESKSTMGVYDSETLTIKGNLNAENEVRSASIFSRGHSSLLASICNGGSVEIFDSPFQNWPLPDDDIKTKRRKATRRSNAQVEIRRTDKSAGIVPIVDAVIDSEGTLILAVADGSLHIGFERISVMNDDGSLSFTGIKTLTRAKSSTLANESMNGVKNVRNAHVDEAGVTVGHNAVDEDGDLEETVLATEELSESEEDDVQATSTELVPVNGDTNTDTEMADVDEEEPTEEPTFGDLVRARGMDTVEVTGPQTLVSTAKGINSISSNLTLGTLLTQALNTNDTASLDTCLAQQDVQIIRATIERLDSGLAITLLQRLAERLHSRPGRAGSLLVWVQWSIIAHGGYLSSRPDTVKQLRSLHKVVQERARSLQPLLALKGKLDMLDAQIAFRKKVHQSQLNSIGPSSRPEDMIYVEGQPESDTEDEDMDGQKLIQQNGDDFGSENEDEEDDDDDDEAEADILPEDNEAGEESSENDEDASETELSEDGDGMDNEVNHDDIDPEDSDVSDSGLIPTRVNGVKH